MKKKTSEKKGLALSLFGDNPPTVKVVLDETAPEPKPVETDKDADDSNCACE